MISTPWLLVAGGFNFIIESGHLFYSVILKTLGRRFSRQPKEHKYFYFFIIHSCYYDDDMIRLVQPLTQVWWYLSKSSFSNNNENSHQKALWMRREFKTRKKLVYFLLFELHKWKLAYKFSSQGALGIDSLFFVIIKIKDNFRIVNRKT